MRLPNRKKNPPLSTHTSILRICMGWWMLAISLSIAAQSNNLTFQKVLLEVNTIPYNSITAITQDKEGYLWISTVEGLIRYDGYESKRYQHHPKDSTSIPHDAVLEVYVDETGTLWAAAQKGLCRYDASCDCFSRYRFQANNKMPSNVSAITEDKEHNLWVTIRAGGLFRYDRAQDKFIPYLNHSTAPNSLVNDHLSVILADRQNNIWIGTRHPYGPDISVSKGGGLIRFNPSTGVSKRFVHQPNNPNSLSENVITALLEDEAGQIWVGTIENGLHLYHPDSEDFTRIKIDPTNPTYFQPPFQKKETEGYVSINILHQDQQDGYWIGSEGIGLNHFDPKTRKLTFYDLVGSSRGLNIPSTIYEDRQGQLWLGLGEGGLYKSDPYARKFNTYPALKAMQRSCESQLTPGSFWISTRVDGLHFLDGNTGKKTSFLHDEQDATSIGSNAVKAVYEDKEGTVWVGLGVNLFGKEDGKSGLGKMDRQTHSFQHYKMKLNDTTDVNTTVFVIEEDQEGFLWLNVGARLIRFDKEKEISKQYELPNEDANTRITMVNHNNQFFGVLDRWKRILYKYNIEKDSFMTFVEGYGVTNVVEDNQGGFWLGTWWQGLVYFNPKEDSLKQYTEENGLLDDRITGLLPGENGNYWLATYKGLVKFDSKNEKFISEGFPKDHFGANGIKSRDGQLFLGGEEGVYAFYPNQVNGNPFPPDVLIHSLQISGEPFNLAQAAAEKINLSHQQNNFNFQYTAIHNSNPAENKYQYRLLPFDENWIDAGTQRRVQYTNLDAGDYTFQVKAANSDGVWNETPTALSFHIATPWWTRWWAYSLAALLLSSIAYWFYHFQLSRKLAVEKSKRLEEVNQLKTSLYNNITHEFRTPLTVILGMTDNLQTEAILQHWNKAAQPLDMIQRNGENLLQLVNEMLDLAKLESGHLTLELTQADVIPFIKYVSESFQSLAEKKDINLTIYTDVEELIMDFDSAKLATIVSNLLSNAIKFTPKNGKVIVHLYQIKQTTQATFFIKIKDNGKGISKEAIPHIFDRFYQADNSAVRQQEGTGIGLALTKELVELMQGTIEVKSEFGKGSEFVVQLPIFRKAVLKETIELPNLASKSITADTTFFNKNEEKISADLPLVLIIEDNLDVAHYIKTCLSEKYQTLHAANGRIGIDMALEHIPDLIISDVMMPEKDGFEVCQTLKTDERTNHIPIIMLTAKVTVQDRLMGLSHGADAYLAKPFEKEELLIRLHNLFQIRQLLQKKYSEQLLSDSPTEEVAQAEDPFIIKARNVVLADLDNENFSIQDLSEKLFLSRSQLHRKIKALTGVSTTIFIRQIRLKESKKWLQNPELSISEVAYQVGFKTPVYFSQVFKEMYGKSPSELRKSI